MNKIFKNYQSWMGVKEKINNYGNVKYVKEGDVVWAAMGENVGVEIDGKNERFSRPVLVIRKYNQYCFTCVPLTTQSHSGSWYVQFIFQGTLQTAVLNQTTFIGIERVYKRIGEVPSNDFQKVLQGYIDLLTKQKYTLVRN